MMSTLNGMVAIEVTRIKFGYNRRRAREKT
jgi:hypothetical protein